MTQAQAGTSSVGQAAVALSARGVSVAYGTVPVLDRVDLDVRRGEILSLVGPNGAGKSTLLAVLAGDVAPDTGTVEVDGRDLDRWRVRDLARERAVLTQEHRVAFPFTVAHVVAMGRTPWRGHPHEEHDDVVVAESLDQGDLHTLAHRPFPGLSGGEKGRTALARTLAQRARVLLLDEPTAALDLGRQEQTLARARTEAERGVAVVVVLHDLSLAAAWSDRVVLLHRGAVLADGPPVDVLTPARLTEVYDHPVEVLTHPVTGDLLVMADRRDPSPHPDPQEFS